jgi:flavin reductase (DIM6/NTAB) family NADH-FMN oxidoreductase RutF
MSKTQVENHEFIYPMPVFLVGTNVNEKPNFMTAALGGMVCDKPPLIYISLLPSRYTLKGIRQNWSFSVNLPSSDIAKEVDYCGMKSGSKVDKVKVCKFEVFYGKLSNAPMIKKCPANVECTVVNIMDLGSHTMIIGRIESSYISDNYLTDRQPDMDKINPLIFTPWPDHHYQFLGGFAGKAFSMGTELKNKEEN